MCNNNNNNNCNKSMCKLRQTQQYVKLHTVKPLMFACPVFCKFREPNKTAKLKGANINCRPKNRTKLLQYFKLYGFNSPK